MMGSWLCNPRMTAALYPRYKCAHTRTRVMVAESQRGKILKGVELFAMDGIRRFFPQR